MPKTGKYYFKACPRCKGDLYKDSDMYGVFVTCIQCGFDATGYHSPLSEATVEEKKPALAVDFVSGNFKLPMDGTYAG